ncbi:unnamed protein product [Boreogadus saida]
MPRRVQGRMQLEGGMVLCSSGCLGAGCDRKHAPAPGAHAAASRGHTGSSKGHGRHHATCSESSERGNLLGVLRSCGLLVLMNKEMNHGQEGDDSAWCSGCGAAALSTGGAAQR